MVERREILKWAVAGVALGASETLHLPGANAQQSGPVTGLAAVSDGRPFSFEALLEVARDLSRKSYQAPSLALPDAFSALTYDSYVAIRSKRENHIWNDENRGFVIEPLHRGFVFAAPVAINIVEDGVARRLVYAPSRFDFGKIAVPETIPDIGFSGFRIHGVSAAGLEEFVLFQGASFFRAKARQQNFGVAARAVALRTADPKGEEFPFFRAYWIERPTPGTGAIVVNALADTDSLVGAFRMTIRPGDATIVDIEATIFSRVALDHVGIAPMQSSYLFGGTERDQVDDLRPNVHESSGLQMFNARGEWIWRPLANPDDLQISAFVDNNPRGFGLIQRDRDPSTFYDDDQRFELRPTLWVEPIGDWGPGTVNLIEIPSENEVNSNIIAYWRPQVPLAAGGEHSLAYRQFWGWTVPGQPPMARVNATRSGKGASTRQRRFMVEFAGDTPNFFKDIADLKVNLSATPGTLNAVRVVPSLSRNTCRVVFDFDPGSDTASEMRLVLEAAGKPVSETWLYRWTA